MSYSIVTCNDQTSWQKEVDKFNPYSFMQGKDFWEYCTLRGYETHAFIMKKEKAIVSLCLTYIVRAKRGTYLAVSHGPLFEANQYNSELFSLWNTHLSNFAKKNRCHFIRLAPPWIKTEQTKIPGFLPSPTHLHAEQTSIIDLTESSEELLAHMRKNTRSLVRKALRLESEGILVSSFTNSLSPEMYQLYEATTERGRFTGVSQKTIEKEIEAFQRDSKVRIITITTNAVLISWGMFILSGNRAYYRHGANRLNGEYRNLPSPYLVYWNAFLEAKKMGAESYDLWGVSPKHATNHPWKNISLYKVGFGGEYVELAHAIEKPLSLRYWATRFYDGYQARSRGFRY